MSLIPAALPEVAVDAIELSTCFLGHTLRAPLVIASMTGGYDGAAAINEALGECAEKFGLAVGVGSQRAALGDPGLVPTYSSLRRQAPSAFVIANLGACQLVPQGDSPSPGLDHGQLEEAVAMVGANALAIHLNALEESIQPEGDGNFEGIRDAIGAAARRLSVPVIAKETGSGIDRESARSLCDEGLAALDVGGCGGTSFAWIEARRAELAGHVLRAQVGQSFVGWGIPTAAAVLECRGLGVPVIATGGIRSGLDAAKALALGADLVGIGGAVLESATLGREALFARTEQFLAELRLALLLCGATTPSELRKRQPVLSGKIRDWAEQRDRP